MLYAKADIPLPSMISHNIQEIYDITKAHVAESLQATHGCLHFGINGWTSSNVISYLGITVACVVEGKVEEFVLDYVRCTDSHTGEYMVEQLIKVLDAFGICNRGLRLVANGAAPNGVLADKLTMKGFLKQFNHDPKKHHDVVFDDLLNDDMASDDDDTDLDEEVDIDESKPVVTLEEARVGQFAIFKMTQLGKKSFHNSILYEVILAAFLTQWNMVSDMLAWGIELRVVLTHICDTLQFNNSSRTMHLHWFILSDEEWTVLEQCSKYLGTFKKLTLDFSHSGKPIIYKNVAVTTCAFMMWFALHVGTHWWF
ncbi:hypothetical protein EV421DRAFT_1905965 [Armillaria borealis]|uniref:Uncharacterized protein n=1 Tax=Armillaria borealis TaxID=47425 RepID=A0AA39MLJ5_9AGAR|nr:hypothetical protein EV421DRAFT_1905965 [Armillaria borealis]